MVDLLDDLLQEELLLCEDFELLDDLQLPLLLLFLLLPLLLLLLLLPLLLLLLLLPLLLLLLLLPLLLLVQVMDETDLWLPEQELS